MSSLQSSYPPNILQNLQDKNRNNQTETNLETKDALIPIIDMESLDINKLDEVCKDWGIFNLVSHGIPLSLMNQIQEISETVFSLSFESKQALITTPLSYFWGTPALTPSGDPLFKGHQMVELVEGMNVPLSQLSLLEAAEDPLLQSFRILMEEYGHHLDRVSATVFEAMVKCLNIDLEKYSLSKSSGFIRAYRYPSCYHECLGMNVHTDSSVISILNQDQVGGLEFLKNGEWFRIKPSFNTLVVNLGDMMQAISNDEYKSVEHRVRINKDKDRFSICYFVFPYEDCIIQSSNYKPFTYTEFRTQVQQDIKTSGSKVGLTRFKLDKK